MSNSTMYAASWLINPDAPPLAGGAILVRNGRIAAIGPRNDLLRTCTVPVIDHPGCAIIPGFINAHTHLELTHYSSWREKNSMGYSPRRFVDWIIQVIKLSRGLKPDELRLSLSAGLLKSLAAGSTTIGDIITHYDLISCHRDLPVCGRLFFEVLGHEPEPFRARLQAALSACTTVSGERLFPALSPHAAYTIAENNLDLVSRAAKTGQLPLSIHIAESEAETAFVFDSAGQLADELYPFVGWQHYLTPPRHCSSVELLDRHGLLTPSTLAVHCVHVTLADVKRLKERGVSVCLCPRSNELLDVGRAPVALFNKIGLPLALGTDSLASNNSLSIWDEMRFTLDAFARDLSPADVFRMGTSGGAAALGLSGHVGSLQVGKRADFQIVKNIAENETGLLERLIGQGTAHEIYCAGRRYIEATD